MTARLSRAEMGILSLLASSPMTVYELSYRLGMTWKYVSIRLQGMRQAGQVKVLRTLREPSMTRPLNLWGLSI